MKLSRIGWLLAVAFFVGTIPACKKNDAGKIKVAVVTNNPAEFWTYCQAGVKKASKDFDVEVIFRKPDKGDVNVQMDIVKALEKQGIAGIAVSVIHPEEQAADLKILAGKMKLVTMDNDAENSNRICYVGTDNYAAGKEVGRLVKEAMPDGGTIAIFVGMISPLNAKQRFQGVVDELAGQKDAPGVGVEGGKKFGNYLLHRGEAITDGANPEQAQVNAAQVLEQIGTQPKVCMIGLWAYNSPKILEAARGKSLIGKIKVVGFDEDWDTLAAIDKGEMYATVVQDPFNFGYKSVEILAAEARGDKSKSNLPPIPYRVVTKDGGKSTTVDGVEIKNLKASEFRDQLNALLESVK